MLIAHYIHQISEVESMKWKWFLVIALVLFNVVLITIWYGKVQEKQERQVYSAAVQESPPVAPESAKNAVIPDRQQAAPSSQKHAFRNVDWGMSVDEVKRSESGKPVHEQDSILMYNVSLSGMDASCGYLFTNGNLFRGVYTFNLKHTNENDYIADYDKIKAMMIDKHGKPKQDEVNWKNDRYKTDPQKYGFAVSLGHLVYFATWETEDTNIVLELTGDNYKINVKSSYWSKTIKGNPQQNGL